MLESLKDVEVESIKKLMKIYIWYLKSCSQLIFCQKPGRNDVLHDKEMFLLTTFI